MKFLNKFKYKLAGELTWQVEYYNHYGNTSILLMENGFGARKLKIIGDRCYITETDGYVMAKKWELGVISIQQVENMTKNLK